MNFDVVLVAMLPEHILLAGIVLLVALDIAGASTRETVTVTTLILIAAAAAATCLATVAYTATPFAGHYSVDAGASSAKAILLALTVPVVLISRDDFAERTFHILLLSSLYGACLLVASDSFLMLFLGLEIMSLPVYVLVLLAFQRTASAEAALKYLVLGGTATATLLMGASLLYGATGSLALSAFTSSLASPSAMETIGVVLVLLAFLLKAAVVPFHAWAPDAYEGAAMPVTAYMAAVIKGAVLFVVVRLAGNAMLGPPVVGLVVAMPLLSIVWGNLTAMRQQSFRRMIAYSSIAHAGYLFYALLGEPASRFQAVAFYVLAYGAMNILAFAALPRAADDATRDRLVHLKGLFGRDPAAAILIALAMLSLAGIPPLPGFVAKFMIFKNVIAAGYTAYAVAGLIGSYIGIYFYLRVVQYMFMSADESFARGTPSKGLALGASVLCLIAAFVLGVFPGWVIDVL